MSVSYDPDRTLSKDYLRLRDTDLIHIEIDVDGEKVCYYDQFGLPKLACSENDFETSLVLDSEDIPWIVDRVEGDAYYFNSYLNQFLPSYDPEIVDPSKFISRIWKETKRRI